ncbi:MATE family efflux transporter [Candidatus Woesearchaeota archaeon]|nr:MAG: MATE family efflux transporter [Candidatus Woesearchaeota archaeon]
MEKQNASHSGRRNAPDLTSGSIIRKLLITALPMIAAMMVETGYNIVDTIFVGRLGPDAIAAVTLVFPVAFVMIALAGGIATGTNALVARYIGAKKYEKADNVAEHSILIAVILGAVLSLAGLLTIKPVFALAGATGNVMALVNEYVSVIYIGAPILLLGLMANGMIRGIGNTKMLMKAMITGAVANTILDPVLIFYFGLGIKGAAIATVTSRIISAAYMYRYLLSKASPIKFSIKDFSFNTEVVKKLFVIGIPSSISQVSMALGWAFLAKIASLFGSSAIATLGIGFRIDSVAIMPLLGLGIATLTLVGQNLGAGKSERARQTSLASMGMASSFVLLLSVIFYLFAPQITRVFTSDVAVSDMATTYLRLISPAYFFVALNIIVGFTILGTGNAVPQMILTLIRVVGLSAPLAYFLAVSFNLREFGLFSGIALAYVLSGIISLAWFRRINWAETGRKASPRKMPAT